MNSRVLLAIRMLECLVVMNSVSFRGVGTDLLFLMNVVLFSAIRVTWVAALVGRAIAWLGMSLRCYMLNLGYGAGQVYIFGVALAFDRTLGLIYEKLIIPMSLLIVTRPAARFLCSMPLEAVTILTLALCRRVRTWFVGRHSVRFGRSIMRPTSRVVRTLGLVGNALLSRRVA